MGYGRFAPNNRPKEGEYYYHIFIGCLFSLEKIEEQPTPPPVAPKADAGADTLYRKNSDGKFVPVTADKLPVASPVKKEVSSTPSQKTPALKLSFYAFTKDTWTLSYFYLMIETLF